jgi:hypothetical protein
LYTRSPSASGFKGCQRCAKTLETFEAVFEQWYKNSQAAKATRDMEHRLRDAEIEANRNWGNLYCQIEEMIEEAAAEAVGWGLKVLYPADMGY